MRRHALLGILPILFHLPGSDAFAQSYDMNIHLSSGQTVTIPHDEIQRIEFADGTGIGDLVDAAGATSDFQLFRNYPNPFGPSTTIAYEIPAAASVTVRVYDLQGAMVRELVNDTLPAGRHSVAWDGRDARQARVSSGVYFYAVEYADRVLSHKLILVK